MAWVADGLLQGTRKHGGSALKRSRRRVRRRSLETILKAPVDGQLASARSEGGDGSASVSVSTLGLFLVWRLLPPSPQHTHTRAPPSTAERSGSISIWISAPIAPQRTVGANSPPAASGANVFRAKSPCATRACTYRVPARAAMEIYADGDDASTTVALRSSPAKIGLQVPRKVRRPRCPRSSPPVLSRSRAHTLPLPAPGRADDARARRTLPRRRRRVRPAASAWPRSARMPSARASRAPEPRPRRSSA